MKPSFQINGFFRLCSRFFWSFNEDCFALCITWEKVVFVYWFVVSSEWVERFKLSLSLLTFVQRGYFFRSDRHYQGSGGGNRRGSFTNPHSSSNSAKVRAGGHLKNLDRHGGRYRWLKTWSIHAPCSHYWVILLKQSLKWLYPTLVWPSRINKFILRCW